MAPKPKPKPTAAPKGPMTKTVIRKVSPNVKVIKPGSKPRTQSATEKAAIMEKAKTKTPAARADAATKKKNEAKERTRRTASYRASAMKDTYFAALKAGGYDAGLRQSRGEKPTAAQVKAANKAVAQDQRDLKARLKESTAKRKAETKAAARARIRTVGGRGGGGGAGIMGFNDVNK